MNLKTPHAEAIISMLEDAQDIGMGYTVWSEGIMNWALNPSDFNFFDTYGAARAYLEQQNVFNDDITPWDDDVYYFRPVETLLEEIKQINGLTKEKDMNRNNAENIREEMKNLRFSQKAVDEAQQKMEKGLPDFTVNDKVNGNKGQVDITAHFRQSGQSDNYYLNKFVVALNTGKALEEGQKIYGHLT
ncbi:hypothetical protein ACFJIV_02315 [Mucilaginibacter sp. UC70_90]